MLNIADHGYTAVSCQPLRIHVYDISVEKLFKFTKKEIIFYEKEKTFRRNAWKSSVY